jgi:cyanate lyase
MVTRDEIRELALEAKHQQGLTWEVLAQAIHRSPVYTAMLLYGYGQATP